MTDQTDQQVGHNRSIDLPLTRIVQVEVEPGHPIDMPVCVGCGSGPLDEGQNGCGQCPACIRDRNLN